MHNPTNIQTPRTNFRTTQTYPLSLSFKMPILLPINSKMTRTYNRPDTIRLLFETLEQMKRINKNVCYPKNDMSRVVSMNIVKHLAHTALHYLLKVSYLEEQWEYIPIYELFDDVRSLQYRSKRFATNMTQAVWYEYESMSDELDSLHERLKTIRVNCEYCRKRAAQQYKRVSKKVLHFDDPASNISDLRTSAKSVTIVEDEKYSEREAEEQPKRRVLMQFIKDDKRAVAVPRPFGILKGESLTGYNYRVEILKSISKTVKEFERSKSLSSVDEVPKLIEELNAIVGIFTNINKHAEYIATTPSFRSIQTNVGKSFMQVSITKCIFLSTEIPKVYDRVRRETTRADPTLRSLKHRTLECITETLRKLCKLYNEHPIESESIDTLYRTTLQTV